MLIRQTINTQGGWLGAGLAPTIRIMSVAQSTSDDVIELDLSRFQFINPMFVVSLFVYLSRCGKKVLFHNAQDYHQAIHLPEFGLNTDGLRQSALLAIMERYSSKTFVPIVNFSALTNGDERDVVSTAIESIIIRQLNIPANVAQGLRYMISETIDNIPEHSQAERGFIFAQAYPVGGFLDLCIADNGITLRGSYEKTDQIEVTSDLEAIRAANDRVSSKNRPDCEGRGFGIYTVKKMLTTGLHGQYLIASGDSLYVKGRGYDNYYHIPAGLRWDGTIVALRIPYQDNETNKLFDCYKYTE